MASEKYLQDMKAQKFGIEIEFSFITRYMAKEAICRELNSQDMIDAKGRKWKIVNDSSIVPKRRTEDGSVVGADCYYSVELNSPILEYDDLDLLGGVLKALRDAGAEPSEVCGIHIHISEDGHTVRSLRNLINMFMQKEDIMKEAFQIDDTRQEQYCQNVNRDLVPKINRHKARTLNELFNQWDEECCGRYRMLNIESLYDGMGIEFRLFNSTLNMEVVKAYIVFCLAVSQKAKTMQRSVPIKSKMDNNRYDWRNFLNRLGLAGDEFKEVRRRLLMHVSGDAAFHSPEKYGRRRIIRH